METRRSSQRDIGQKLKVAKRERDDSRDRVKLIVRHFGEDKEMMR